MNRFRLLKPEEAARRAIRNVAAFRREQERKALEEKGKPNGGKPATKPPLLESGLGLRVLATRANGLTFRQALELANKENLVLASNKRMSRALVETEEWKNMREALPCWTGTMAGYAKPDERLGEFIEYTDPNGGQKYVFPVPEQYRNEKNMILVVEHPNFSLFQDGNNLVVEASGVIGLANFPEKNGWYLGDGQFDIPYGGEVSSSDGKARRLWRIESRVGPVRRDDGILGNRQDVGLGGRPSDGRGVVTESPVGGAPAKKEGEA